jgi:hypothetical protein
MVLPFHPLSSLVEEGLNKFLIHSRPIGGLKGTKMGRKIVLSHMIFVDHVQLFMNGSITDVNKYKEILGIYMKATGMQINNKEYSLMLILRGG